MRSQGPQRRRASCDCSWSISRYTPKPRFTLRKLDFIQEKPMPLSLAEFVERWKAVTLTERAAAQSHFIDLCEVLASRTRAADQTGESFTFEKAVSKLHGGKGFADVWKRGFFAGSTRANITISRRQTSISRSDEISEIIGGCGSTGQSQVT